jgi:uracil-DNA glycosylase
MQMRDSSAALHKKIRACTVCAPFLPFGPRPIIQFSSRARILIIAQAPSSRVHAGGLSWDDASGDRLRAWTGLAKEDFYEPTKLAFVGMGFCYPGKGENADLPPRPECAPLWHDAVFNVLPKDRLTILVGIHAMAKYLPGARKKTLTETVRGFGAAGNGIFPLPHPSWRVVGWMKKHPWFESEVLPVLQQAVKAHLPKPSNR